ncbi:MAG: DUF6796 family protein, partial [Planctomycetota bacterium]
VGAALGVAGDLCLTYSSAVPGGVPYEWDSIVELVRSIPADRLRVGHYLGVLGIPLSIAGFFALYELVRPAGRRYALPLLLGPIYLYAVGCAYHGQPALLGEIAKHAGPDSVLEARSLMWTELSVQTVGLVLLALWFPWVILTRPTRLPRWTAACSPAVVAGAWVLVAKLSPEPVRMAIEVATFNLTVLVILCTVALTARGALAQPGPGAAP